MGQMRQLKSRGDIRESLRSWMSDKEGRERRAQCPDLPSLGERLSLEQKASRKRDFSPSSQSRLWAVTPTAGNLWSRRLAEGEAGTSRFSRQLSLQGPRSPCSSRRPWRASERRTCSLAQALCKGRGCPGWSP